MVKISYEGRTVHFPCAEVTAGELISFFLVERPGMHLKFKRGSGYQNIWPDANGLFKCPQDVDAAILIAIKEAGSTETEEQLEMLQNTPTYSAYTSSTGPAMDRYNPSTGTSTPNRARRGNATAQTATMHRYLQSNQPIPCSTSTFTNISRSFGARPAPSVWNANLKGISAGSKRKKGTGMETKSFRLTFFDTDSNAMQDMWDIPIDLSRLAQLYGMYSVFDITRALQNQLGEAEPDAKAVVTDIKGNPIKDMVTTRGNTFWAAQKVFRVFYIRNFADWKPHVWNSIKSDYGFHSEEEDDDDVDFSPSLGLATVHPSCSSVPPNSTVSTQSAKGTEAKLDKILTMLNTQEEKKHLQEVFKCLICRETACSLMLSCATGCGRFLGCFSCLFHVESCPVCRASLPCVTDRKPLLIPGLATILGVPEVSLKSALKQLGAIPQETSDDSDLEEESMTLSSVRRVRNLENNATRDTTDGPDGSAV